MPLLALVLFGALILALVPTAMGQSAPPETPPATTEETPPAGTVEEPAPTGETAPPVVEEIPPPVEEPVPPVVEEIPPPVVEPPAAVIEEVIVVEEIITPVLPEPDKPNAANGAAEVLLSSKRVPVSTPATSSAPDAPPAGPVTAVAPTPSAGPAAPPVSISAPPEAPAALTPAPAVTTTPAASSFSDGSGLQTAPAIAAPPPRIARLSAEPIEEIEPVADPGIFTPFGTSVGNGDSPSLLSVLAGYVIPNAGGPGTTTQLLMLGLALLLVGWALARPAVRMISLAERTDRRRPGFRQPQLRPG